METCQELAPSGFSCLRLCGLPVEHQGLRSPPQPRRRSRKKKLAENLQKIMRRRHPAPARAFACSDGTCTRWFVSTDVKALGELLHSSRPPLRKAFSLTGKPKTDGFVVRFAQVHHAVSIQFPLRFPKSLTSPTEYLDSQPLR